MKKSQAGRRVPRVTATPGQRSNTINGGAYFRGLTHREETGEAKDPADSWREVEAEEIAAILRDRYAE